MPVVQPYWVGGGISFRALVQTHGVGRSVLWRWVAEYKRNGIDEPRSIFQAFRALGSSPHRALRLSESHIVETVLASTLVQGGEISEREAVAERLIS